jgi:hypothetical protein
MQRLLITIIALAAPALTAGVIAPAISTVAGIASEGSHWHAAADRYRIPRDADGRIHFAADANARYTIWDGKLRLSDPHHFHHHTLEQLQHEFPGLEILPESSPGYLHLAAFPAQVPAVAGLLLQRAPNLAIVPLNPPQPTYGGVTSEGVAGTGASQFHNFGLTGQGARVAILDLGFGEVQGRMAGEVGMFQHLPSQPNLTHDFDVHGTACAEVVRDVAPDAELLLMRLQGLGTYNAVEEAILRGCDVLSVSLAWMGYPANGVACDAARHAMNHGVLWVNAAGNWQNKRYWEAAAPALNDEGWVQFASGVSVNRVTPHGGTIQLGLGFEAPDSDWARYELVLFESSSNGWAEVATGLSASYFQYIDYATHAGRTYAWGVRQTAPGVEGRMRVQTFFNDFQYSSAEGALTNPATVPGVISVGAIHHSHYAAGGPAAGYSSAGGGVFELPLTMCAPSGVATLTYNGSFHGTSASAPHVAGMLALLNNFADPLDGILLSTAWSPRLGWGAAKLDMQVLENALVLTHAGYPGLPVGASGLAYPGINLQAVGGTPPHEFAIIDGKLPAGMHLTAFGTLNGTPTEDGNWEFSVLVQDAEGLKAQRTFELVVLPQGSLLIVEPHQGSLPDARRNQSYAPVIIRAEGGDGGHVFSVAAGALPPGMNIAMDGTISGTPANTGTWGFTLRVADGGGATFERDYSIAVKGPSPIRTAQRGGGGCTAQSNGAPALLVTLTLLLLLTLRWKRMPAKARIRQ